MTKEVKARDRILKVHGNKDKAYKNTKSRNRSSTGCLTCRKRKKKCDEKLYPKCLNCQGKGLNCEWTAKVQLIYEHLSNVRYYGENTTSTKKITKPKTYLDSTGSDNDNLVSKPDNKLLAEEDLILQILGNEPDYSKYVLDNSKDSIIDIKPTLLTIETQETEQSISTKVDNNTTNVYSEPDRKKDFLKRIALQQDCVDDI